MSVETEGKLKLLISDTNQPSQSLQFWDELYNFIHPIIGPFLDPVLEALQDSTFRLNILNTIVMFCVVLAGMIFLVYEGPAILRWMSGDSKTLPAPPTPPRGRKRVPTEASRRTTTTKRRKRTKPTPPKYSGVTVESKLKPLREGLLLSVYISNELHERIDMVVVNVKVPDGISLMSGSFRMQRLGTIMPREGKTVEFKLRHIGGDVRKIGGYVEFLAQSSSFARVPIPPPDYGSKKKADVTGSDTIDEDLAQIFAED